MAVAHRGHQESIRTDTSDPWISAAFTTNSGDRGLLVSIVHGASDTDHVVGVSFGGESLTRIVRATDTATERGAAEFWFIGTNLPITTDNITVDLASGTTDDLHLIATALTGDADLEVIDFDSISENAANPTVTLQKAGRTAVSYVAMYGGGAAPGGTLAAGNTATHNHDFGAFYSQACRETTVDSADHIIGWSTLSSDDLAFVAVCISEVQELTDADAEVSWAELEVPTASSQAEVAWAEVEVPTASSQAEVSWAALEVPNADARADISWTEIEVPDLVTDANAEVAWTEVEVPNADARADIAWTELEVPNASSQAEVAWAELEVPNADARADVSFTEFEVPTASSQAEVSWAEFEVPTASSQAEVAHAQFEVPSLAGGETFVNNKHPVHH